VNGENKDMNKDAHSECDGPDGNDAELQGRRDFLIGLGKWSKVIIGGALLTGCYTYGGTGWINRRGGGWINGRGYGGGGWINGRNYHGAGGWVNRRGGGRSWINRR
jgi:hypothetical protein